MSTFLSKDNLIPIEQLTAENVTLWFYVVKFISQPVADEGPEDPFLSKLVPELTRFAKYLKDFSLKLKKNDLDQEFLVVQLFRIAGTYSLNDEMGREQLRQISINYLIDENAGSRCIPVIARLFDSMVPSVKDRLVMLAEMVSDIREPLQPLESSQVLENEEPKTELPEVSCEPTESQPKTDVETLLRCLSIMKEFFNAKDVTKIDATLLSLKDLFLVQCLAIGSTEVQNLALEVMTFYFIRSVDLAKEKYVYCCFLLLDPERRYSALACVIDMLVVHGFEPFSVDQNSTNGNRTVNDTTTMPLNDFRNDPSLTPTQVFFVSTVAECLDSGEANVRARACLGLAKLLYAGVLNSPLVLARLILIWFSPSSAKIPEIRQMLSLFLNIYPTKNKMAGKVLSESIFPLLRAHKHLNSSDQDDIDPLAIAKLLVSLLRSDICLPPADVKEHGSYHLRLAVKVCRELLLVNSFDHYLLSKILQMIELDPDDAHHSAELMTMLTRGIKKMGKFWDKKVLKVVESLKSRLEKMKESLNESNMNKQSQTKSKLSVAEISGVEELSMAFSECRTTAQIIEDSLISTPTSPIETSPSDRSNRIVVDETMEDSEESPQSPPISHSKLKRRAIVDESSNEEDVPDGGVIPDSDEDLSASDVELKSLPSSRTVSFKEPLPPGAYQRTTRSTRKNRN